jgi:hypothetical protein
VRLDAVAIGGLGVAIGAGGGDRRPVEAPARDLPASRPGLHRDQRPRRVEALDAAREPRLSFAALSLPPISAATWVGLSQILTGSRAKARQMLPSKRPYPAAAGASAMGQLRTGRHNAGVGHGRRAFGGSA